MERLGKEMVGWCSGNPLAILVLRGVLVTKPALLQWQMVYNRNKSNKHQQLVEGDVARVLVLSYNELPYQLKPCYLYICGNEGIRIDRLFMLWSAEGMILSRDKKQGETTIDVANRYLGELVGRNMVEIGLEDLQGPKDIRKLRLCNLHDLMRELCVSIAKKEEFLKVTDVGAHINSMNYNDFRVYIETVGENRETLDVFPNMAEYTLLHMYAVVFGYNSKWHVNVSPKTSASIRSLRIKHGSTKKLSELKKLKLLRVLDLERTRTGDQSLSKGIGDLIHMRLLSLKKAKLGRFPSSLGNLMHLQTLDLRVMYQSNQPCPHLPNVFWKLKKLRHLFLPSYFDVLPKSSLLRLDGLPELVTLVNVIAHVCNIGALTDAFTNLYKLKACVVFGSEYPRAIEDLEAIIKHSSKSQLNLRHNSLFIAFVEEVGDEWKQVLSGCHWIFDSLRLQGLKCELPNFLMHTNRQHAAASSSLPHLTKLTLKKCTFDQDPMPILEKLSTLRTLKIGHLKITQGDEITFSAFGFPQLRYLLLVSTNLVKWRIEQGAMPNLSSLDIMACSMEMLPEGLKFITTLQQLGLRAMHDAIESRIQPPDGEDFYKIQHVPDVNFTNSHDFLLFIDVVYHRTY